MESSQEVIIPFALDIVPSPLPRKKVATLYKANGAVEDIKAKRGKLTYEQLKEAVGGMVEIVPLPSGKVMVVNEEGKVIDLPRNENATRIWNIEYPKGRYPVNNDETVVGDAIVCSAGMID